MRKNLSISGFLFALSMSFSFSSAYASRAQVVPVPEDPSTAPQIEIAGAGIGTLGYSRSAGHQSGEGTTDYSDSALLIGAAQKLYDGGIGSFGLGWLTTDPSSRGYGSGSSYFAHQAFVDYQTQTFEALIGRTDSATAHLVDFPTLRGDDLVTLTNPVDPFSNGENTEEHRYSNVGSVTLNQDFKYFESIHVQHLINSASVGTDTGINSFGVNFEYFTTVGQEMFNRVPTWGAGVEHIVLGANSPGGLNQFSLGGVLNLNESVTNRLDLRAQGVVSVGSDLRAFQSVTDSFQADASSLAMSIRYLNSPFGKPGYQIGLTTGWKSFTKVDDARSFGWALTGVKRLGQGFDFVAQSKGQWRDPALARVQSAGIPYEQVTEVGFIFDFSSTFNQHISPRRSMLNQQHGYVPN
jgi:hypothetical protein